ncbi:hypothetical protein GLOTRDRAFT_140452 [Gloeophyllum trabeum ATCC 11539]|uniref:Uncharacterized protein n=1 Tax=Gloeophyllum trabeum (strain ATCC 11539 / FP-39264 / Madison 617) TaxID=670483 RepID=S7PZF3_GLOTA|nr:uncharacterized protein GLOTRDRAFT_140452 [Gloeophyllum trabeum ATCC 11539]EPQ52858.1 hypothetical protein GLOTRDRAFT_140452 [Gloeophyllum trabeum ATCC 11539]
MIPRYANPYNTHQSTVHVSRAELAHSDDEEVEPTSGGEPHKRKLEELEALLKSSLGEVQDIASDSKRRKRRKVEAPADSESAQAIPFRLVSRVLPPRPVMLQPLRPDIPHAVKERPSEDDQHEAEQRRQRALVVAVDFEQVVRESTIAYSSTGNRPDKVIEVQARLPSPAPPIMITERPRPCPLPPTLSHATRFTASLQVVQAELGLLAKAAPVVEIAAQSHPPGRKSRRARRKCAQQPRPPPSFWRPNIEWGGKSLGYAMGYEGSLPIREGEVRQYARDTMRKAVYADWAGKAG